MRPAFLTLCLAAVLGIVVSASAAEQLSADELLRRAEERFQALKDYECLLESETRSGKRREAGVYRLWLKRPHMFRLRVLKGKHRGSEVAEDAGGTVRGHEGGLLKPIVVRLSATDRRLRSIRGVPVTEMDWGSFYRKCRERCARPGARVQVTAPASADAPYELTVSYTEAQQPMREVYRIDPQRWVLLEGDVFEGETRVDHVRFYEIKLDTGVRDGWFKL
jgi:hypothetical protein